MSPGVYSIASQDKAGQRQKGMTSDITPVTWPTGALGDLVVNSGTTTKAAGTSYDYRNITVAAGAILRFAGGTVNRPTALGYTGTFTNNGTVQHISATAPSGTQSLTAPDGHTISMTYTCGAGGDGGDDGALNGQQTLGDSVGAGGGGSAVFFNGGPDGFGDGGYGADGDGNIAAGAGGPSGTLYGGSGGDGGPSQSNLGGGMAVGGGGGGGTRSTGGGALYIKGGPSSTATGTGTVKCSASASGIGGTGGNAVSNAPAIAAAGGGGGGGGGGACGGKIEMVIKGSAPSWTLNVAGAVGGAGGNRGTASGVNPSNGFPGTAGANGANGTTSVTTY